MWAQERTGNVRDSAILIIVTILFFVTIPCGAHSGVSVSLKLDRTEATLADSIRMVVGVSGTRSSDLRPVVQGLENFGVSQGGTSTRLEVINGQVNSGADYTYFLRPQKTGTFQIGPARVSVDGRTFISNQETLTVTKPAYKSGLERGPLFLFAGLSSSKVYVEEQAIYTLRLYHKSRVSNVSLDLPKVEDLTFKQLGKPQEYQGIYDGQSYQVVEVRYALIPSRAGSYAIGPSRMNMTVIQPKAQSGWGLFDDPFFSFSSGRPTTLASDSLKFDVLPLPQKGRPADFCGLVGDFKLESRLEPSKIKAGDSATLTVLVSGRGNANRIPDLKMPGLDHIKVYADEPVLNIRPDEKGLAGSKTMKWALVPEKEGNYEIPPLSISFFDISRHQYRELRTSTYALFVMPGGEQQAKAPPRPATKGKAIPPAKQVVKEIGRDILPVHTSMRDLEGTYMLRPDRLTFLLVVLIPVFVYATAFWTMKLRKKSSGAGAGATPKKAARTFIKRYRKGEMTPGALTYALRDYLNERFGLSLGLVTPDEAGEILESRGVSSETANSLRNFLQRLEDTVYSGKGNDPYDMGDGIVNVIRRIERELR